jgi:hypothetical protein
LYVVTYDEEDALFAFADEFEITYPLLSDPDSSIIKRFGILNTLVDPDDHPFYGIPFPGSYVVGGDGVIVAKFFESELQMRANGDQLLRAALGQPIALASAAPRKPPTDVAVEVAFDGDALMPNIMRDLLITLRVPDGQHLYGQPVPDGLIPTSVTIDDGLPIAQRQPEFPPTREHRLSGTGEMLQVFDGDVRVRIPVVYLSSEFFDDGGVRNVTVSGTVRWQSCDDEVCHLPAAHRFEIEVPVGQVNMPEFVRPEGSERMDFGKHFQRMIDRRVQ